MSPEGPGITLNPAETRVKPCQACEHDLGMCKSAMWGQNPSEGRVKGRWSVRHRQDKRLA